MQLPSESPNTAASIDETAGRPRVLSVSSLNRLARSLLEGNFPAVLVEGEISNFSTPASGHWYLTLKDARSQLRCAMFRNSNRRVRFRPADGVSVLVRGRLSIYEARGDYQLIIDDMEEAGDGALRRAFEELKARLAEEGLFKDENKQPITGCYRHVGVITSSTGAAFRDILNVFRRRFPGTRITLLPVSVQGNEAANEIVSAIQTANRLAEKLQLEALLLARGGGSLEDLQPFNEERVARAIYTSKLPLVCGVGHEIDFTIADFVADLRAPTPSAAAELLSPSQQEYRQHLLSCEQTLISDIGRRLQQAAQQVGWLSRQLKHPGRRLQDHAQSLDLLDNRLRRALHWQINQRKNSIRELRRTLLANSPWQRLTGLRNSQISLQRRLHRGIVNRLSYSASTLNQLVRNLNAVSPLNVLARGYSITYDEKKQVLRHSKNVKAGSLITTRLHSGTVKSKVLQVQPGTLDNDEQE
jgi:exodeoxyribonuclease VII large subunit